MNPKNTTIDCLRCGNAIPKSLAVRIHRYDRCNLVLDRDYNAFINILNKGLNQKLLSERQKVTLVKISKFNEARSHLHLLDNNSFERKIDFGDPVPKITKFATSLNFDIIVIGIRGMSGIKEKLLDSVSNYVVHKSSVLVMIVK